MTSSAACIASGLGFFLFIISSAPWELAESQVDEVDDNGEQGQGNQPIEPQHNRPEPEAGLGALHTADSPPDLNRSPVSRGPPALSGGDPQFRQFIAGG